MAAEVNTNFQDVVDGSSDGTIDFSISALTCAGAASFQGNVTLGNASGDDVTVTGSLASSIPVKTTNSFDIGGSTTGLAGVYIAAGATYTVLIAASSGGSANWTFTLPNAAGTAGQGLQNTGSGTVAWKPMQTDTSAKTADYTVADDDGIAIVLMTTSTTDRTVTLPTAADNTGRVITVKKVDSGSGTCTVDGEGAETIDGATTVVLESQYNYWTGVCDGTGWHTLNRFQSLTASLDNDFTGGSVNICRVGNSVNIGIESNGTHSSLSSVDTNSGFVPSWAVPSSGLTPQVVYSSDGGSDIRRCLVLNNGTLRAAYSGARTSTGATLTLCYAVP